MRRSLLIAASALGLMSLPALAGMPPTVMVGGQAMYPGKTIVGNAVNSADHTTLVAAVKAAGLADALNGAGPFTVFAPTNEAFADLPAGTVPTLLKPENKKTLATVLEYHVVPGTYSTADLRRLILAGNGTARLKTLAGGELTLMMNGPTNIIVKDAKGQVADISIADVNQSNGVIHVIDRVLMPS